MYELEKDNIQEYLKTQMPGLDYSKPLHIHRLGDGNAEEDGDGYLNFIYRVSDGHTKLILKQGRDHGARGLTQTFEVPIDRNKLEYETMKIRRTIVPEYVPGLYFYDAENSIMAVEDVSHLKVLRYQFNKNVCFPLFAKQIADFMAKSHFYTSEYYLDTKTFRDLTVHFMNHEMRNVFDDMLFITQTDQMQYGVPVDEGYMPFVKKIILDPLVVEARYEMRHKYITNGEALVHADLSTSNIMMDERELKVIDMEYTFCGPFASDIGYLESNILSQFICAGYRPFENEAERNRFREYCLDTMAGIFDEYVRVFFECWDRDAKDRYRNVLGLKEQIAKQLLSDVVGFTATATINRCSGPFTLSEYNETGSEKNRAQAVCTAMVFARTSILKRDTYKTAKIWASELAMIDELFKTFIMMS